MQEYKVKRGHAKDMCKVEKKLRSARVATEIPNRFITDFLADFKGEYIKLYLLLQYLLQTNGDIRISYVAESLDWVEGDVLRALKYLAKRNLLEYELADGELSRIMLEDLSSARVESSVPKRTVSVSEPSESPKPVISENAASETLLTPKTGNSTLYDRCEQALGTMLGKNYVDLINMLHNEMGMPDELVVFLFEYCRQLGRTGYNYMEKIGVSWYNSGIKTVSEAKKKIWDYTETVIKVRDAFGIDGKLGSAQVDYVDTWLNQWNMEPALIEAACQRSLSRTEKKSFEYANKILSECAEKQIHKLSEYQTQEEIRQNSREKENLENTAKTDKISKRRETPKKDSFNDFEQHEYTAEEWAAIVARMQQWD